MKSIIYPLLIFFFALPIIKVYVCNSKNATKYHYNKDCRGLKNCNYHIKETTLEDAKKRGMTLCGWEK